MNCRVWKIPQKQLSWVLCFWMRAKLRFCGFCKTFLKEEENYPAWALSPAIQYYEEFPSWGDRQPGQHTAKEGASRFRRTNLCWAVIFPQSQASRRFKLPEINTFGGRGILRAPSRRRGFTLPERCIELHWPRGDFTTEARLAKRGCLRQNLGNLFPIC